MHNPPKAAFSIKDYRFTKVYIDLDKHDPAKSLDINFDTSGKFVKSESLFDLHFKIAVFDNGRRDDPFIKLTCEGIFQFTNVSDLSDIPEFFFTNSVALLFPYVRAYLTIITTQANTKGIMLPTLNLSALGSILKKNTSER